MRLPFCEFHTLQFLISFTFAHPLDASLHDYFRKHKSLGSKDRKKIAITVYGIIRNLGWIDAHLTPPFTWEKRLSFFLRPFSNTKPFKNYQKFSFPKWLYQKFVKQYGEKQTQTICSTLNQEAPFTLRINTAKISREKWMHNHDSLQPEKTLIAPNGCTLKKRENLFQLESFKKGEFEVQDEGSQLLAEMVQEEKGKHFLDFCAGAGGKTLALAPFFAGKGQLYLYDVRIKALQEAKKRLKRAGVQNYQILSEEKLSTFLPKMDAVFLDIPCSGTGTLRRNPDRKWTLSEEELQRLVTLQKTIFTQVYEGVRKKTRIYYATCSILKEENELQVRNFLTCFPLKQLRPSAFWLPVKGKMDGFFLAFLEKS